MAEETFDTDDDSAEQAAYQQTMQELVAMYSTSLEVLRGLATGTISLPAPTVGLLPVVQVSSPPTATEFVSSGSGLTLPTVTDGVAPAPITVDTSTAPTFNVPEPILNIPTDPLPAVGEAPSTVPVISDFALDDPTLPTVDSISLATMSLPTSPDVVIPLFGGVAPTINAELPTTELEFAEEAYQSALADSLRTALLATLTGPSGYSTDAETALFDLSTEEEQYKLRAEVEAILDGAGERGFHRLDGGTGFAAALRMNEYAAARNDVSRKIAAKQMELEQANIEAAITDIIALEGRYMQAHSEMANRALDAAKYVNEAALKVYNLQIEHYNAAVDKYRADVEVYKAQIEGVKATVKVYEAEIEGVAAVAEGNSILAAYYAAQIDYLQTAAKKYQATMEGRAAHLKVQKAQLQGYGAAIEGFAATIEGRTAEITAYLAQVEAVKAEALAAMSLAQAAAERAQTDKIVADELAAVAEVNYSRRKAVAAMNELQHESARVAVERALIAVTAGAAAQRLQADKVRSETVDKVADIEKATTEAKRAEAQSHATMRRSVLDAGRDFARQLNSVELAAARDIAQAEQSARVAAARALQERYHKTFAEDRHQEHLDPARSSLLEMIANI